MTNPISLNGHPVILSVPHANGHTTVMVDRGPDSGHRYVVATWAPILANTWSWGHYFADLAEANEAFREVSARNAKRGNL